MADEEQHPTSNYLDSTGGDPERQRLVQQAGELLLSVLDSQKAAGVQTPEGKPTNANDFVAALEELLDAGWAFDASSSPATLRRVSDVPPSGEDRAILGELQKRYPFLPEEIAEIAWWIITGNRIISGIEDLRAKSEAVERLVLTEEVRKEIGQATARINPPSWEPLEALDPRSPSTISATHNQLSARLDRAYEKLDQLLVRQHTEGKSPELERDIEAAWAILDELQESVSIEVRQQLDASVEIPPSRLEELLHHVDAELNGTDEEL